MKKRTFPQRHDDLLKENTRLLNIVTELRSQVTSLKSSLQEYQAGHPRDLLDQQTKSVQKWMQDAEMLEACRQVAWTRSPGSTKYWVDEKSDYAFPEGWPSGVSAERSIADALGLDVYLGKPSRETLAKVFGHPVEPPTAERTYLHSLMEAGDAS